MRGVKSEATKRREQMGIVKPPVDPAVSQRKRKAAIRSVVSRGEAPPEAEGALIRLVKSTSERQSRESKIEQETLVHQLDAIEEGRQTLREVTPAMAKRLGRIALGQEPEFGSREQIQAMRLVADIVGFVSKQALPGGYDAPLTQQSVSALRQVISSGEERIRQLQRAIVERDAGVILE
jgi:hypothetical protein